MVKPSRFYIQSYEALYKTNPKPKEVLQPYNYKKYDICPTITTKPDALKTAILVVEKR